jgi:hypothetical protein
MWAALDSTTNPEATGDSSPDPLYSHVSLFSSFVPNYGEDKAENKDTSGWEKVCCPPWFGHLCNHFVFPENG